jgi:hypothetical protein
MGIAFKVNAALAQYRALKNPPRAITGCGRRARSARA